MQEREVKMGGGGERGENIIDFDGRLWEKPILSVNKDVGMTLYFVNEF